MKKVLSYILISLIISANLLAPISVGWGSINNLKINKQLAEAADINWDNWDGSIKGYQNAFIASSLSQNSSVYVKSSNSSDLSLTIKIDTGVDANIPSLLNWLHLKRAPTTGSVVTSVSRAFTWNLIGDQNLGTFKNEELLVLKVVENGTNNIGWIDVTSRLLAGYLKTTIDQDLKMPNAIQIPMTFNSANGLTSFKPGATYTVGLYYLSDGNEDDGKGAGEIIQGLKDNGANYYKIVETTVNTADELNQIVGTGNVDEATTTPGASQNNSTLPACSVDPISKGTFMGCVVQFFYYVLFVPTSYLFALAGTMFDYTFSYSVQDSSYRSAFVTQGWGLVRDFCNMFFIFIMLYVAIGTILSLHSMKTKETIINVVIIGLFINFSLFATQVMIDASNITARVFYNSDAIKITEKSASGVQGATPGLDIGADGTIPLSAAIVNKVNPQNLIMSADKISSIKNNNSTSGVGNVDTASLGVAQFILIIIMASAVNIVGFTVFLTVAFLFVARVVGLWLAMIIAPLAFFTYITPGMAKTKMIGWENWWPETLKLAFLAPVFIFFMYLILKFLQADLITDVVGKSMSGDGLGYFVSILVPFAFIMILMIKAKKIATDMSGEFGEMAVKAGSAVSGMVLGGAVGVGAMAMRGTIGAAGSAMANSKWAQGMASSKNKTLSFIGNKAMDTGQFIGKKSFDARNTKLGAAAGKGMGIENMGKAAEGGFEGAKTRQITKDQKRAKELEPGQNSQEKKDLNKAQETLKDLENKHNRDIEPQEAKVTTAQQDWSNANSALLADKNDPAKIAAEAAAKAKLDQEKAALFAIKNGGLDPNTGQYRTTNGNISQAAIDGAAKDLVTANNEFTGATQAQTTAANALGTALNNIPTTQSVAQARTDLTNAQNAAATAATRAAAPGATTADAINHTNALSIQAAAQAKMDKINSEVQTTTTAYNNAVSGKQVADSRLTATQTKHAIAVQANSDALNAQTLAMANGGVGESINEIKSGSLKTAQKAYDDKANTNKINYANNTKSTSSKVFNVVTSLGAYSPAGADEAAHNIRMDVKT